VARAQAAHTSRDLKGLELALPGPRHALRGQFDALCVAAGVTPRPCAEVDDMAMLRLVARVSGWLTAPAVEKAALHFAYPPWRMDLEPIEWRYPGGIDSRRHPGSAAVAPSNRSCEPSSAR